MLKRNLANESTCMLTIKLFSKCRSMHVDQKQLYHRHNDERTSCSNVNLSITLIEWLICSNCEDNINNWVIQDHKDIGIYVLIKELIRWM
jgi:hypothetical protein